MASVGQALWHAVATSPSRTSRPSSLASIFARLIRWTQKVHFSITPFSRTVTSGLSCRFSG